MTAEYARYSRTSFGLAPGWMGAWLVLSSGVALASPARAQDLLRATPLVWLLALARTRAHYQRHGEVVETEQVPFPLPSAESARRFFLAVIYFFCVVGVLEASRNGRGALVLGAVVFVAVPALAARAVRGYTDSVFTAGVLSSVVSPALRGLDGWLPSAAPPADPPGDRGVAGPPPLRYQHRPTWPTPPGTSSPTSSRRTWPPAGTAGRW